MAAFHDRDRRFAILGTAGHIDHGKSSLVRALTGVDPDRLPEEKARGMTIELGFAHLDLPEGRLGIVDVPGHERFVRTMVSGATGIDLAALVVAADDGVMPQTREHLEILDFLGVERGVIVVSKCDAATAERAVEVARQAREAGRGTAVERWRSVIVSAVRGDGLDALRSELGRLVAELDARRADGVFRMAIDRVFAVKGRGTVVTGSVLSGRVEAGQTLELLPHGEACKVREMQTHGEAATVAGIGQRAALNLTGIDREGIARGDELATPGALAASRYVDARVRISGRRERGLTNHRRVRISIGTREEIAVAVCLSEREVGAGESGLVQLRFMAPMVAGHGQRFIVRDENGQSTIGGGVVLRPVSRRLKASTSEAEKLGRLESPEAERRMDAVLAESGFVIPPAERLAVLSGVGWAEAANGLREARTSGAIEKIGAGEAHREAAAGLCERGLAHLMRHHARHAQEPGVLVDRFVGWLERRSGPLCGRVLLGRMRDAGQVVIRGPYVASCSFRPALSTEDSDLLERLVAELTAAGLDPPEWGKLKVVAGLSRQRSGKLLELARTDARLVQVGGELMVEAGAILRLKGTVRSLGEGGRRFKLAEVRDALKLSRRAVLPMLEYLDRSGMTRRVGDERVLSGPER